MDAARLHHGRFEPASAPGPVEYRAITPPDWSPDEPLPLVLVLHGAGSSAATLDGDVDGYARLWAAGTFPRAVVAGASTPTVGGFYIDRTDGGGRWETLVGTDLPAHLQRELGADLRHVALLGTSMGGYGALKLAVAHPDRYVAVAALAPAVLPGETWADVGPRNTYDVLADLHREMAGGTDDEAAYAREHVVARLRANADAVRSADLAVFLDVGDRDCFNLHDGAEHLHRALWDLDIAHEYRLVGGADHVGPPMAARVDAARAFLAEALTTAVTGRVPPAETPDGRAELAAFQDWLDAGRTGPPPDLDLTGPLGAPALRLLLRPTVEAALGHDPTAHRRYGVVRSGP